MRAVALLVILFAGCAERLNVASEKDIGPEIDRVAATLPKADAAKFRTAARVVAFAEGISATSEEDGKLQMAAQINGKTPDELIAEYEQLDPETKTRATVLLQAQKERLDKEAAMKERLKHLTHSVEELKRIQLQVSKWSKEDRQRFARANGRLVEKYEAMKVSKGDAEGELWYDRELTGKSAEQIMEKYGDQ